MADATDGAGFKSARWISIADATALTQAAYQRTLDDDARAIARCGRFAIVLAGGDTQRGVHKPGASQETTQ
jgi:6-phosphogluconolactonase/glucosamine-6-phosphate isomerase/deaminase